MSGSLTIVGIGPGEHALVTHKAEAALRSADCIVGYEGYVELVRAWLPGATYASSPISFEVERAREAVDRALAGQRVALIGSGDAGIYGLAGLAFEILEEQDGLALPVEVVPGVTAALAAAALLGAPLGHDFAVISLSDLLTPWSIIRRRVEAAASADFVTVLYNPTSRQRRSQLREAIQIFLAYRNPSTPIGHVISAYRSGQRVAISTLASFDPDSAGMLSTIIVGNSTTWTRRERMITPRGYMANEQRP